MFLSPSSFESTSPSTPTTARQHDKLLPRPLHQQRPRISTSPHNHYHPRTFSASSSTSGTSSYPPLSHRPHTPSPPPTFARVDTSGALHDPDYQHFPPPASARRPRRWEEFTTRPVDDDDAYDDDDDDDVDDVEFFDDSSDDEDECGIYASAACRRRRRHRRQRGSSSSSARPTWWWHSQGQLPNRNNTNSPTDIKTAASLPLPLQIALSQHGTYSPPASFDSDAGVLPAYDEHDDSGLEHDEDGVHGAGAPDGASVRTCESREWWCPVVRHVVQWRTRDGKADEHDHRDKEKSEGGAAHAENT
jgi:hypothetical protein